MEHISIDIQPCQYLFKSHSPNETEDEDDEFDEEEDEKQPKFKVSNVAKLICSLRNTINSKIAGFQPIIQEEFYERFTEKAFFKTGMYNAYYPFDLMGHNFLLKCAGVEVTQPVMRF